MSLIWRRIRGASAVFLSVYRPWPKWPAIQPPNFKMLPPWLCTSMANLMRQSNGENLFDRLRSLTISFIIKLLLLEHITRSVKSTTVQACSVGLPNLLFEPVRRFDKFSSFSIILKVWGSYERHSPKIDRSASAPKPKLNCRIKLLLLFLVKI